MDLKQIQELIKFVAKSGVHEVKLEKDDIKITIRTGKDSEGSTVAQAMPQAFAPAFYPPQMPPPPTAPQPGEKGTEASQKPAAEDAATKASEDFLTVNAPMIGTFYRSPGPEKDPFVKVGDKVTKGQTLCIIEAMKLFNEIESEVNGTIVKVLAEDASPVEYDQPLFQVDPS